MTSQAKDQCKKCGALNADGSKWHWTVVSGIKYCGCCGRRKGR